MQKGRILPLIISGALLFAPAASELFAKRLKTEAIAKDISYAQPDSSKRTSIFSDSASRAKIANAFFEQLALRLENDGFGKIRFAIDSEFSSRAKEFASKLMVAHPDSVGHYFGGKEEFEERTTFENADSVFEGIYTLMLPCELEDIKNKAKNIADKFYDSHEHGKYIRMICKNNKLVLCTFEMEIIAEDGANKGIGVVLMGKPYGTDIGKN